MPSSYPILNNRPIDQWKVTDLKEELKRRKLTTRGLKDELIKRLHDSIRVEVNALKQEELLGSSKQVPDQQVTLHEPFQDPIVNEPIQEDSTGNHGTIFESGPTIVSNNEQKSTTEANELTVTPVEELIASTNLNASVEKVCSTVPVESNMKDKSTLQSELEATGEVLVHVKTDDEKDRKSDKGMDGKSNEMNDEESKDMDHLKADVSFNQSESNNQVSEVKPDLGFPVNCESISTDSVSINEKNELKDNLNTDDFHLELGVFKPEIVHQSSSDGAAIGDDLHALNNIPEMEDKQDLSEEMEDVVDGSCEDLSKKNGSVDGEKLNLDRSSGDESMGDDVVESKQIEFNVNLEVVEDRVVLEEVHVEEPVDESGGLSPPKKDVVEDEGNILIPSEKRKPEENHSLGINESSKRQRLWNTDTLKSPEQQISSFTSLSTPIGLSQSTPKQTFMRSYDSYSNLSADAQKERIVPPSQKAPTNSLRIDHFLRPFTLKAVRELLGRTGTVCSFWMDDIKTHCYVTYSSEEEAVETRSAVYNLQWPPNGGRLLIAEFVNPHEVKDHVEAPPVSPASISPSPITPASAQQNQSSAHSSRQRGSRQQLHSHPPPPPPPPPPPTLSCAPHVKEKVMASPPFKKPNPPILTLDDIFKKTKATPRIYYLPLSEEVKAKIAVKVRSIV